MIGWDIETGPEEEAVLKKRYKPFDKSSVKHPGKFDPASVNYGVTKDPDKRKAKLEEVRAKHEESVKNYSKTVEAAAADHWNKYVEKAALHPATGRLLAFGAIQAVDKPSAIHLAEFPVERDFLTECWGVMKHWRASTKFGWNIHGFDLPFLILRSAILEVDIPSWVRDKKLFFDPTFVDLEKVWAFPRLYNPFDDNKLNTVAGVLGCGSKDECECDGAGFHKFYFGGDEQREKSIAYLKNDLVMTWKVGNVLQVL